jgi:hypothetical protein
MNILGLALKLHFSPGKTPGFLDARKITKLVDGLAIPRMVPDL